MRINRGSRAGSAVALAACLAAPVPAAETGSPEYAGEFVTGPQYYADSDNRDSAKFEEYRDVPSGFVLESLLFTWRPSPGWYLDLAARDVVQRDQQIFVEFGKLDLWKGEVHWRENVRRWTDDAFQLFTYQENGVFTLDDALQTAVQAAPASVDANLDGLWDAGTKGALIKGAIDQSAPEVPVGYQRETGGFAFEFTPTRSWTFGIAADRERRTGTNPQSLGMYFALAPAEVAAPVDFKTDTAVLSAEYSHQRFQVAASLAASDFSLEQNTLIWDDQLFLSDVAINANQASPGRGRVSLGTDNQMVRYGISGAVNLPGHTRIDASYFTAETTQDDPFLPMTINSQLTPAPLPADSLDGAYDTTTAQLRVSSRPLRVLRWDAWWRTYEMDNNSPSLTFTDYVATDYQFPLCGSVNACDGNGNLIADDRISRRSLPYGYERTNLGASVGFTPVAWFTGTLGFERESMQREFSAVEDADEDTWKLALDFDASERVSVRATYRQQERRADDYHAEYFEESFPIGEASVAGANEGLRRYSWTDRDRESISLMLDVTVTPAVSIYGEATWAQDDYFDPLTGQEVGTSFGVMEDRNFDGTPEPYTLLLAGRTDDETTSYGIGVAVTPSDRAQFWVDYTREDWEYGMRSRYRNVSGGIGTDEPRDDWGTDTEDTHDTATLGFGVKLDERGKWRLEGDLSWSKGEGTIDTDFVPGGSSSGDTTLTEFPELESTLTIGHLALTQVLNAKLDYSIRYWYESWDDENFGTDFSQPYMGDPGNDPGSAQSIFLGLDFDNYTNHIVSVMLRYRF